LSAIPLLSIHNSTLVQHEAVYLGLAPAGYLVI